MIARLLFCWTILAVLVGSTSTGNPDPEGLAGVVRSMRTPGAGVKVTWGWEACGGFNAWYDPATRHITMCEELRAAPEGFIRYVFAHEYAHAIIVQRGVPYTGSHEVAADELAGVIMSLHGYSNDIIVAGEFWASRGRNAPYYDDHPDDDERGFTLMCIGAGYQQSREAPGVYVCGEEFDRRQRSWWRLLGIPQ